VSAEQLRSQFPVLNGLAYLNSGTCGPVPAASSAAAEDQLRRELQDGRSSRAHFERRLELAERLRAAYAGRLGCSEDDVALTSSTTDGIGIALAGLDLGEGDEVITSDSEHPGVLGPLQTLREMRGITVRMAPLAELPSAATEATRAVVCSHVSWVTGELAPVADLAALGVTVILDGAQGVGAIPVDVGALECDVYAASGQKWLCGPEGAGMLYVAPETREALSPTRRGYMAFEDPNSGLDARLKAGAQRYEPPSNQGAALLISALAALEVLGSAGWDAIHERAVALAARFAEALAEHGREVVPRDATTLVAWRDEDPEAAVQRLAEAGVVVRYLPGRGVVRASVGAWNDESDLDRLLAALDRA
jgi:L-cysteine/cystine lyase